MSVKEDVQVFYVGFNGCGESGFSKEEKMEILELTACNIQSVNRIYSGNAFTYYTNKDHTNIMVAGNNFTGACGVNIEDNIDKLTPLTFFNDNNIKIKSIHTNAAAESTFFISEDDKLYGCGRNENDQLSQSINKRYIFTPTLVPGLKNIIDIKCAISYNLALCSHDDPKLNEIISVWCKTNEIPQDLKDLISNFCKSTKVYLSTGPEIWNEVAVLNDKDIIKIGVGAYHSVCLSHSGDVYVAGDGSYGQLGLGEDVDDEVHVARIVPYFKKNKIKIIDIASGANFNLALDDLGRVYSWGVNTSGQCGCGTGDNVFEPELIEALKDYKIEEIKCGYYHSYCRSECGKRFLWGSNHFYHECVLTNGNFDDVHEPLMIDKNMLMEKYGIKEITDVFLGCTNTKIIART